MPNQELIAYIRQQLTLGVDKKSVHNALIKAGWQEHDVEAAFGVVAPGTRGVNKKPQGGPGVVVKAKSGGGIIAYILLFLGLLSLILWIIPIIGGPFAVLGLILGYTYSSSDHRTIVMIGLVLCTFGFVAVVTNTMIGVYTGVALEKTYKYTIFDLRDGIPQFANMPSPDFSKINIPYINNLFDDNTNPEPEQEIPTKPPTEEQVPTEPEPELETSTSTPDIEHSSSTASTTKPVTQASTTPEIVEPIEEEIKPTQEIILELSNEPYAHTSAGFEITPPNGWRLDSGDSHVLFIDTDAESNLKPQISVTSIGAEGTDLATSVEVNFELLEDTYSDFFVLQDKSVTNLNGDDAHIIGGTYSQDGVSIRNLQLLLLIDDMLYVATASVALEDWDIYKTLIAKSLLTLKAN